MRIVIAGATGFIGRALCAELGKDYEVVALSRDVEKGKRRLGHLGRVVRWDGKTVGEWGREIDGALGVVNLAGENVGSGRWSKSKKQRILESRLDSSKALAEAVRQAHDKPKVVVLASAIGYYGSRGDEELDEGSGQGHGFLAEVCRQSESFATEFEALGVRSVAIRTGVVLGEEGGMLAKLRRVFRFYLGGYVGSGRQWLSWVSLKDEVAAIRFLMEREDLKGAFNLTSPEAVRMKEFCRILGGVLGRPVWMVMPGFVGRLIFGEMADEMLLSGQKVFPRRLLEAGFSFSYETVESALTCIT